MFGTLNFGLEILLPLILLAIASVAAFGRPRSRVESAPDTSSDDVRRGDLLRLGLALLVLPTLFAYGFSNLVKPIFVQR